MGINLVHTSEIEKFFLQQAEGDLQLASWLNSGLMRSVSRRAQSAVEIAEMPPDAPEWLRDKWDDGPFHRFHPDDDLVNQVRHIVDWLACARQEKAPFLQRCDAAGVPLKIRQLSLESAFNAANKYFGRAHSRMAPLQARGKGWKEPGVETVMELAQGRRIVEMTGLGALKAEGIRMKHCVAGYGFHLMTGSMTFFSLRDADGKPQATFSITAAGTLDQCKGQRDKPPQKRDMDEVVAFLNIRKVMIPRAHPDLRGYFQPAGGAITPFYALPAECPFSHRFSLYDCDKTEELPAHMTVREAAHVHRCPNLKRIGGGMTVLDGLYISGCPNLAELPEGLMVKKQLRVATSGLRQLPPDLEITGDIVLQDCPALVSLGRTMGARNIYITDCTGLVLPEHIIVQHWLYLIGSKQPVLMQGVTVEGCLALRNCAVVGEGLHVTGSLYLQECPGIALPKGLRIGGDLTLVNCGEIQLPEDMSLGGKLKIEME